MAPFEKRGLLARFFIYCIVCRTTGLRMPLVIFATNNPEGREISKRGVAFVAHGPLARQTARANLRMRMLIDTRKRCSRRCRRASTRERSNGVRRGCVPNHLNLTNGAPSQRPARPRIFHVSFIFLPHDGKPPTAPRSKKTRLQQQRPRRHPTATTIQ